MNPFSQRSSIPSSIVTGLVGWIGFIFVGALVFGFKIPALTLFLVGLFSALAQVTILKLGFFLLKMQKHLLFGASWGLITATGMYFATAKYLSFLNQDTIYWLIIYLYIGGPVGAFLSYFYIDDKKIFDNSGGPKPDTNFGRDAKWLEPFTFGAFAYLLAFFPFHHLDLTINVFIVGAISGVFAVGASHFSPDAWKKSIPLIAIIILGLGISLGSLSGLLFRAYTDELYESHILLGAMAGVLTYLITFLRGRQLAAKEEAGNI